MWLRGASAQAQITPTLSKNADLYRCRRKLLSTPLLAIPIFSASTTLNTTNQPLPPTVKVMYGWLLQQQTDWTRLDTATEEVEITHPLSPKTRKLLPKAAAT